MLIIDFGRSFDKSWIEFKNKLEFVCWNLDKILYYISGSLFLLLFKPARECWSNPRLWICMTLASLGLIPILWFNISYNFDSAVFYFIDRHPWQFDAAGLLHIFKQAALSSPPMYLLFLLTIYLMVGKVRTQSLSTALLLSFSLTNLLIYLVLAPLVLRFIFSFGIDT